MKIKFKIIIEIKIIYILIKYNLYLIKINKMFGRYDYGRYQSGSCCGYTIGYQNQPKTIYAPFYHPQEAHRYEN